MGYKVGDKAPYGICYSPYAVKKVTGRTKQPCAGEIYTWVLTAEGVVKLMGGQDKLVKTVKVEMKSVGGGTYAQMTKHYNVMTGKWEDTGYVYASGNTAKYKNYTNNTSYTYVNGQWQNNNQSNSTKKSSGKKSGNKKSNSKKSGNSASTSSQAKSAKSDGNFMLWLKYSYFNDSNASDADWKNGNPGISIPDEKINEWYNEYNKALQSASGKNSSAKISSVLQSAKEKGGNTGNAALDSQKKKDIENDENGTKNNNGEITNSEADWNRSPQYWVMGADGKTKRVLTDKEIEALQNPPINPETGKPEPFVLNGSDVIIVKQANGDSVILIQDEIQDASNAITSIENSMQAMQNIADDAFSDEQSISQAQLASYNVTAFDPRLGRFDSLLLSGDNENLNVIVPFASSTVASCFSDMVFKLDQKEMDTWKEATDNAKKNLNRLYTEGDIERLSDKITAATATQETPDTTVNPAISKIQKDGTYDPNYKTYKALGDLHGTGSLMNPYAITRLYGALGDMKVAAGKNGSGNSIIMPETNRMYDVRDRRRFYDLAVDDDSDQLSISQPTTTNIIKWSNKDTWGRTPYTFTDFVFCKHWNIIPNNRLITLRKYAAPCLDNLNFEGMGHKYPSDSGKAGWDENADKSQENMFSPVATAVTYFGEGTDNSLSELLSMTTGLPWGDVAANIWTVSGDQGSNEAQVTDDQLMGGMSGMRFLDNIAKDIQSFGKFVGLFEKGGFDASRDQGVVDKRFDNMVDPYTDGPFNNRILGPTNKISKMKQRAKADSGEAEDLKFGHNIDITFKYIARPIGGINTKAAMLDIMSNLLEIGSASAVFWGGAHKFKIHPSTYPWGGAPGQKGIMHKLYQGKIFGEEGALHDLMKGIVSMGTDSNGNFSWDSITNQLKNVFQGITGAISQAINSIASSIGIGEDMVNKFTQKGEDMVAGMTNDPEKAKAEQEKGKQKMNALMNNTEQMLKARMIKATTMPTVQGMRAMLIGNPVGNWHLTIGNPLNPIAVIGNLVCSEMSLKFSDEIGPDDFPTELTCKFKLEHGMARDKDAIESMFNRGAGKIYNLPDSLRVTSDYETKVDAYTGSKSWRMGISFTSQASLLAQSGYSGMGMKSSPTSAIVNSTSAKVFIPKFTPVIIPDSGSWTELKEQVRDINTDLYTTRGLFRANLATRKQLI